MWQLAPFVRRVAHLPGLSLSRSAPRRECAAWTPDLRYGPFVGVFSVGRLSSRLGSWSLLGLLLSGCTEPRPEPTSPSVLPDLDLQSTAVANLYVADFVATAATGVDMNDAGDVTGTSYPDPGCGPFCLPPLQTVVWRGGVRIVLPTIPGFSDITVRRINAQAWVAGFAGEPGYTTRAVVWKPSSATSYAAINLGTLPGTTISEAAGIDNMGRVVGWSTTSTFPPNGSPFRWTASGGMVDLSARGFPDDIPLAISPGGTVATPDFWYRLGDPASVVRMPPPPQGFFPPGTHPTAINNAGDQARFLVSTSQAYPSLKYPFRFHRNGTWQQISSSPTGRLSRYDVGSINLAKDITATVQSTGVIAPGPNGLARPLAQLLSPAYRGAAVGVGGPMNSAGQILATVMIGRSFRLMRLLPATPCGANCIRVSQIQMTGTFVQDPSNPGRCTDGGPAHNLVAATVTVTDERCARLAGVRVSGRFLDDYWTNNPVSGTTRTQGVVRFTHKGPCGVGAVAFLVDRATLNSRTFDRTTGVVTNFVIPQ
jgi:hypothetical protein